MDPWYRSFFSEDYWRYAQVEYAGERTRREVDYLAGVLSTAPGQRVLDIGCGPGRHAVALAAAGFDVIGVDVSAWAVAAARQASADAGVVARFEEADVLTSDLPSGEIDAAIAVQSFGWGSDADQLRMLKAVRRHLVPGGVLVLDFSSLLWLVANYEERSEEPGADDTHFTFVRRYDALTGRSQGRVEIKRAGADDVVLHDDVRLYAPAEMHALVTEAGFVVERIDADFVAGAPVGRGTRYAQVVARAAAVPPKALGLTTMGSLDAGDALDLRWAPDEGEFLRPPPDEVWARVAGGAEAARHYALDDPYGSRRGAAAVANHFGADIGHANVVFGAGVSALLRHACELADRGPIVVGARSHPDLPAWAASRGSEVRIVDAPATAAPEFLGGPVGARPPLVAIDRPGIAGDLAALDDLAALATACAGVGATVVVDESYANYLDPATSAVGLAASMPNLVVLRGFSKAYCWGGLRAAFAVGSDVQIERVRETLPPLQVAEVSFRVALELLGERDAAVALRARVEAVKPAMVASLERAGLTVERGHPSLPWVLIPDDGGAASRLLAERGILPKHLILPDGRPQLRLSVPLSAERAERFLELLP